MRDQPAFNLLMHEGVRGHALENAIKLKDMADRGKEGFRMVYYAANATVKLGMSCRIGSSGTGTVFRPMASQAIS